MPISHIQSIRDLLANSARGSPFLYGAQDRISLRDALRVTSLGGRVSELAGRSVLLAAQDQFAAGLAMIELDGVARRLILCPPDVSADHIRALIDLADVDAVVSDKDSLYSGGRRAPEHVPVCSVAPAEPLHIDPVTTQWILLTSGTSGTPKMVAHNLATLIAPINGCQRGADVVWGTFYDIRRYGGLQIFFRALLGSASFVFSSTAETPAAHLLRLAAHKVTHLTGTPSHWRRALMSPAAGEIAPRYIRLSGEIVEQGILNTLHAAYPQVMIVHAFASTEAGVAFEVDDGFPGFPANFVGCQGEVEIKVKNHSLHVRSPRTGTHLVGQDSSTLKDREGFVNTGDIVERRGDRYYFLGRQAGIINVGGLKVHPEEIEALLNRHPAVEISCVRAQRNPITGSVIAADVVLKGSRELRPNTSGLMQDILKICRERLPRHKVPAVLNFVPALNVSTSGKVTRGDA